MEPNASTQDSLAPLSLPQLLAAGMDLEDHACGLQESATIMPSATI